MFGRGGFVYLYIYLIQLCMQKSDLEHTRLKVPDTSTAKLGQPSLYSPLTFTVVMISELSVEMFCAILVEFTENGDIMGS